MPQIQNRSLTREEALKAKQVLEAVEALMAKQGLQAQEASLNKVARATAKKALTRWYTEGFHKADRKLQQIQISDNLQLVTAILDWKSMKHEKDGYIMLKGLADGTKLIPVMPAPGLFIWWAWQVDISQIASAAAVPLEGVSQALAASLFRQTIVQLSYFRYPHPRTSGSTS